MPCISCYNMCGDYMKYPKYLKIGDTIGLFAPSFGANTEPYQTRLKSAINKLTSLGYKTKESAGIFDYHFGASAKKEVRADAFMSLYMDASVDFIWSVGGGEWMMDIIPLIDFELLKTYPPKFVMGYSDNTHLTFLMNTLLDTVSIYGQNLTEFGMNEWDSSLNEAFEVISGTRLSQDSFALHESKDANSDDPLASYQLTEKTVWKALSGEENLAFEGRLIGGCLDILMMYPGLPFDRVDHFNETYKNDGIIWFLEACDLNVFSLKRGLWQLKERGFFKNLKGIVFGRPLMATPMIDIDQYSLTKDILNDLNVPIIMDADFGHIAPTFTILSGAYVKVTYKDGKGNFTYIER